MADAMDRVQQHVEEELERNISRATQRQSLPSAFFCESCGADIPQKRRQVIHGVRFCVTCQDINERRAAHYRKGE